MLKRTCHPERWGEQCYKEEILGVLYLIAGLIAFVGEFDVFGWLLILIAIKTHLTAIVFGWHSGKRRLKAKI